MPDWLELELAEELRPAPAPNELWDRISAAVAEPAAGRRPVYCPAPRRPVASWASWPIAAIVTLMIAAATLWLVAKGQEPSLDLRQLAIQELRAPAPEELRSSNPAQINDRMRREAGVELGIPESTAAHLTSARTIQKGGTCIAAVTYRVGDDTATLLVARASSSLDLGHGQAQWQAHGQTYALAISNPDHSEAACILCHATL
jgi:hypothetical protein